MERMEQYHITKKEMIKLEVIEKLIDQCLILSKTAQILWSLASKSIKIP